VKHALIRQYRDDYPLTLMCDTLDVSRTGFYAAEQRRRRPLAPRARANQRLRMEIRAIHTETQQRYGAPKIHQELLKQGIACGRHRVARLMREEQLRGCRPRAFRVTTESAHAYPIAPNVLARRFAPANYWERDRVWVADITYLSTAEGWLYLAVLLDLASRRVVAWCADTRLDQSLTLRPLQQALQLRRPAAGLIHHSDRGVQYAATAYRELLAAHGAVSSMSRTGNCWDNAVAESFFATLKIELVHRVSWPTRAAAHRDLERFIDVWYNHQRRHAALGYRSPVQYERDMARLLIA
jgi:transposase InsO family protein